MDATKPDTADRSTAGASLSTSRAPSSAAAVVLFKVMSNDPRRYSRVVAERVRQAPSRAMLRAVGFRDEDFAKPQIGIASTWANLTPCNMHIGELAREAAARAGAARRRRRVVNNHHAPPPHSPWAP